MSISVAFIIKNGIKNGYCFWESLQSCLPFANELIISDGYSDDDTLHYLMKFKNKYKKKLPILLYQDRWEEKSYHGEVITKVSERAIAKATKTWVYYLQADEIIHEGSIAHIKSIASSDQWNSASFPFYHFTRGWKPSEDGYKEAIRMIRRGRNIKLMGDAWNFEIENASPISPAGSCPKPIYHFNWVFPKNNDIKDIEHAKIYENIPEYQDKMREASKRLKENKVPYPMTDFNDFPKLATRFLGKVEYPLP